MYTTHITARGSVRGDLVPMDVKAIEADAAAIYKAGMDLMTFLAVNGLLPAIGDPKPRGHKFKSARKKRVKE